MSIQIRKADRIATEVTLRIPELEELVHAAQENCMQLALDRYHDEGYRYYLRAADHALALRSNDIGDVARYLGLTKPFAEAGVALDTAAPTEYVVGGQSRFGSVPLQSRNRSLFDPAKALPCNLDDRVDPQSRAFSIRRWALFLKSGYGALDCGKALRMKEGNAAEALALLISTNGFAHTKV
jgi:hypothetical protein